ncbi:siderophore-interacting protein [Pontixanthobacter aquaemixtae]|uniref:Siderophore-interacting protein n=1 Tax=Pontixanthobacter aquaemixtae TaxID=1958940 RepID=A0A844ZZ79_9SPHN|nr:siderophore-interacting protein [Pontixanthobacter aquaemixtae]MXO90739.1 siderophore-interacting protein [Pontixanthobacter aquaemixtae]
MAKPAPRSLSVLDSQRVSPSMLQITLGGPGLAGFPQDQTGGYIKLMLPDPAGGPKPVLRTYTIRAQRQAEIDVHFALHGGNANGLATGWALAAERGDTIAIGGPGPAKPLPDGFDFYAVAGDMSALPAISANLERLGRDAKGVAVLEIQHRDDAIPIDAPAGIEICWIVNPKPGTEPGLLAGELRRQMKPDGKVAGWAACEFSAMRELRALLRGEWGLGPRELYISSYWKHGLDEIAHKKIKRQDAEEAGE